MRIAMLLVPLLTMQGGKLEVKDLKVGTGPTAKNYDYLTMDYTGTLMNGKQFDSSIGRAPFNFILGAGEVIKGWDKGVLGMKVGGKRVLIIPSDLGYGPSGAGADIPPNAKLKFVIELKRIDSVKTTTIRPGKGEPVKFGDSVSVHYKGMFTSGKKFDSSYDRGQPMPVTVGRGTIPGFTLGILGMKQGEKRRVFIPSKLAYGPRGAGGGVIPPNSDLVFELELVQVNH